MLKTPLNWMESFSLMRWGVWCDDPEAAVWLKAWMATQPMTLAVVRVTSADGAPWQGVGNVEFLNDWPALLVDRSLDAVFLAGVDDGRLAAMRQLAEQDRPLYIWPDARHGLPFAYELALIADQRPHVMGVWRHRGDPLLQAIAQRQIPGPGIDDFELERSIDSVSSDAVGAVRSRLLADLDLLRWLGAKASRVTALRSVGPDTVLRKQSVHLASDSGPGASWVGEVCAARTSVARLSIHGRDGCTLIDHGTETWKRDGEPSPASAARDTASVLPTVPWTEVVRVFEWFDACEHSLERRRTIELHSEPVSERTVFKTQMTALGCGVLMVTLLFALVYLAIGATIPLPGWMLIALRAAVFAPLFLFLIAQLLLPLAKSPAKEPR